MEGVYAGKRDERGMLHGFTKWGRLNIVRRWEKNIKRGRLTDENWMCVW